MCGYGKGSYRVAYREGEPCPVCGAVIEKVKTGSTSSYICPRCQPLLGLLFLGFRLNFFPIDHMLKTLIYGELLV